MKKFVKLMFISLLSIVISIYRKCAALFVRSIIPPKSSLIGFIYGGLLE